MAIGFGGMWWDVMSEFDQPVDLGSVFPQSQLYRSTWMAPSQQMARQQTQCWLFLSGNVDGLACVHMRWGCLKAWYNKKTETLVIICKKRLTHIHIHIPSYTNIILIPFLFIIHNLWPFILQPLRNPEATDREIGFVMEAGSNPSRSLSVIDSTGITMIFQETNFITAMDTMIYIHT